MAGRQLDLTINIGAGATFSKDLRHRFTLGRQWGDPSAYNLVCWIMLNPSTADATEDDPTIRRCRGFSQRWGHSGLIVVNLFALRATDPAVLETAPDRVGTGNMGAIIGSALEAKRVVCAWGIHGALGGQGEIVTKRLLDRRIPLSCLGTTKAGHPRHPLYLHSATKLERFTGRLTDA